jgi:hypothetical protein
VFEKRTLLAALAAFVTMFLVSWLLFGVVFAGQMESMQDPEMMGLVGDMANMPVLMLSYLVLALMMAFIFKFGYEGGTPVTEGIRFGIFMWLLVSIPQYLAWVAWGMMSWGLFAFNGVLYLVQFVLGGLVIGLILGRAGAPVEMATGEI